MPLPAYLEAHSLAAGLYWKPMLTEGMLPGWPPLLLPTKPGGWIRSLHQHANLTQTHIIHYVITI